MRRRVRIVLGIAFVVLAPSIGIAPTRLLSSGYAVTLPQLNVPELPGDERLRLDVTVQPSDTPVFVGVGPTPAVDAYLRGAPIDVIEQIDWPGAACARSPSYVTTRTTRLSRPDGCTRMRSPGRTVPLTTVPA